MLFQDTFRKKATRWPTCLAVRVTSSNLPNAFSNALSRKNQPTMQERHTQLTSRDFFLQLPVWASAISQRSQQLVVQPRVQRPPRQAPEAPQHAARQEEADSPRCQKRHGEDQNLSDGPAPGCAERPFGWLWLHIGDQKKGVPHFENLSRNGKMERAYCGWLRNPFAPQSETMADTSLFVGYLQGNRIIPGFLRWCRISSIRVASYRIPSKRGPPF